MTFMQATQEGTDVARTKTPTLTMFNQGRNEVLQIPTTHEAMAALVSQREQLNDQLEEVTDRRNDIMAQLRSNPPQVAQASLESELKVLDQRVVQLHNDLSLVGREIARASPELIAMTREPDEQPPGDNFAQGAAAGGASVFLLMSAFVVFARRRWRKTGRAGSLALPAADSERLQRMENGIEAMAIEIERISENQRFVTKLLSESRAAESAPR